MSETINITGMSKAEVLAALYNASKPLGMGFLHYNPTPMTTEEAEDELQRSTYFDYLNGRVMKVDLSGDEFSVWGYDRDNGQGAAQRAIDAMLKTGDTNAEEIELAHKDGTLDSARLTNEHLYDKTYSQRRGNIAVVGMGFDDVADVLKPHLDDALKDDDGAPRQS